ncbi:hypothetical protein MKX03_012894 [Papaver bracteatum]|nr:hypothetical protein MKX03_012894 [Papaver bracteatum]
MHIEMQFQGTATVIRLFHQTTCTLRCSFKRYHSAYLLQKRKYCPGVQFLAQMELINLQWTRFFPWMMVDAQDLQRNHVLVVPPVPVLAELKQHDPSQVADPRPGPAKSMQDEIFDSNSYQHLHIPANMMEGFLRLAQENTKKNLETCGVLAGKMENRVFHITTLIIPKQQATSDSTHPSQTCAMSSVDLHTQYAYQIMLPEAIAIVMAPSDTYRLRYIWSAKTKIHLWRLIGALLCCF